MIRTILIDDETLARDVVKHYLQSYPDIEIVAECCDGFEGLKAITQHKPDFIFLDIQMPKISGFEMLELVENRPAVIFTTAFDEYAIKAFEVNAVDYLLKPIEKTRFDQAMQKLPAKLAKEETSNELLETASLSPAQNSRIVVKTAGVIKIIPVVVMSGSNLEKDVKRAYELGANIYMTKPIDWKEFCGVMKLMGVLWTEHAEVPQHTSAAAS